ncbi:MAG: hypothetical protein LKH33_01350 [Acetobacter sp.]|jgi:hypothetical protein|nr:hypothetical protein [Acetobacter sp.]MCH4062300.1 hypothetical protein [Acetobacter sp.]MCH4088853.1 hypothetical protein [Acetobacter sp.]MCI1292756.1 hypothetical protein [Acetobacter sp.]MCI1319143.1 hypothetical protein [Acetobacter sp.]
MTITPGKHQATIIGGMMRLVVGVELNASTIRIDEIFLSVGIGRRQRGPNILKTKAISREYLRIDLHIYGQKSTTADLYETKAMELL